MKKLNIYVISQEENNEYDTYDSAVVVAEDEEQARDISPDGRGNIDWDLQRRDRYGCWAFNRNKVKVVCVGEAAEIGVIGVIVASFNAG